MTTATVVDPDAVVDGTKNAPGTDADESAAFSKAFAEDAATTPTETPVAVAMPDEKVETAEGEVGPAKPEEPAAPVHVQILKDDWDRMTQTLEELGGKLKKVQDDYGGRLGSLQQTIQQMREATPKGQKVQVSAEDFAELRADFPELADMTLKGFERVIGKMAVGGEPARVVDPNAIKVEIVRDIALDRLTEDHEDWKQVVGLPDEKGQIPDTEFRRWVAKKPADEQERIWADQNPRRVSAVLTEFKKSITKTPGNSDAVRPNARQARLESAVTPKGAGGGGSVGPAVTTEAEAFAAAYKKERG